MDFIKKLLKVLAVVAAIAGVAAAIYYAVNKFMAKKKAIPHDEYENYVSCSCCDDEFVSETTVA